MGPQISSLVFSLTTRARVSTLLPANLAFWTLGHHRASMLLHSFMCPPPAQPDPTQRAARLPSPHHFNSPRHHPAPSPFCVCVFVRVCSRPKLRAVCLCVVVCVQRGKTTQPALIENYIGDKPSCDSPCSSPRGGGREGGQSLDGVKGIITAATVSVAHLRDRPARFMVNRTKAITQNG